MDHLRRALDDLGIPCDDALVRDFARFKEALYEANLTRNLTRVPPEECEVRHFVDSVVVARWIPEGAEVLDLGTGPGFPAWPLARVRPDLRVTSLDGSGKGLAFLREHPLPNLTALQSRAEEPFAREEFDVVTGRALAPLPIQLELSAAFARIGGAVVPFRTLAEADEARGLRLKGLGLVLESLEEVLLTGSEAVRLFPVFRKTAPTAGKYPRPWATIRKAPLR